jgi:hypothetical protein
LAVGIADAIADRPEQVHHGLAVSEDRLENFFLVLPRDEVQLLGGKVP